MKLHLEHNKKITEKTVFFFYPSKTAARLPTLQDSVSDEPFKIKIIIRSYWHQMRVERDKTDRRKETETMRKGRDERRIEKRHTILKSKFPCNKLTYLRA